MTSKALTPHMWQISNFAITVQTSFGQCWCRPSPEALPPALPASIPAPAYHWVVAQRIGWCSAAPEEGVKLETKTDPMEGPVAYLILAPISISSLENNVLHLSAQVFPSTKEKEMINFYFVQFYLVPLPLLFPVQSICFIKQNRSTNQVCLPMES